jgi:hypothetical protein
MAYHMSTTLRNARATSIATTAGASAKLKFMSGTQPAAGGAETTLLATLTFGALITTGGAGVANGALPLGTVSQSNATHVSGTPTWARLTTSADVWVCDFTIPTDLTFTGTIATGVDIIMGACTFTEGQV